MRDRQYNDLGNNIFAQINKINEERQAYNNKHHYDKLESCTLHSLAEKTYINETTLSKYLHGVKHPTLETVMRMVAVLAASETDSIDIIHSAGYDISYDVYPQNAVYREIIKACSETDKYRYMEMADMGDIIMIKRYREY